MAKTRKTERRCDCCKGSGSGPFEWIAGFYFTSIAPPCKACRGRGKIVVYK